MSLSGNPVWWCPACEQNIPAGGFHRSKRGLKQTYCKECQKKKAMASTIEKKYGITIADRDQMEVAQAGRCAICGEEGPLNIDHDHATGRVRSLLCRSCNTGLGMFKDRAVILAEAAKYIERHSATTLTI